ncbi:MAG: amidinotransferase [Bacteroidaceae bacterium]|nr:amidinotransferase [Bacteroidaceae bacterium]
MNRQTTSQLLMVRPVRFAFNEQTAANNAFQQRATDDEAALRTQQEAIREFDAYVRLLREAGVGIDVVQDVPEPPTPDSIFPNNCFSTHDEEGGRTLVLYPMFAPNRRLEREKLLPRLNEMPFQRIIDLTHYEQQGLYLEGTGSLVLDREHRIAYACRSPRTSERVLADWARQLDYTYLLFDCCDEADIPIYHTNVVMNVGRRQAVVCLESIRDASQREAVEQSLRESGKEVVGISLAQMHHFAGNMLEVRNTAGQPLLIMSQAAHQSLAPEQLRLLERETRILAPHLSAIETAGGGSARCMLAEIY